MHKNKWLILLIILAILATSCSKKTKNKDDFSQGNKRVEKDGSSIEDDNFIEIDEEEDLSKDDILIEGEVTASKVFNAFKEKFPDLKVSKIEYEEEKDKYYYKIKGHNGKQKIELAAKLDDGTTSLDYEISTELVDKEITLKDLDAADKLISKGIKLAGEKYKLKEWELKAIEDDIALDVEILDDEENKLKYRYNLSTGKITELNKD